MGFEWLGWCDRHRSGGQGWFNAWAEGRRDDAQGDLLLERFTQKAYPQKQLLGFLLCSWARPVPYHRTKGLKSIAYFGEMKRRFEARQIANP